jgi:hypothetical protein
MVIGGSIELGRSYIWDNVFSRVGRAARRPLRQATTQNALSQRQAGATLWRRKALMTSAEFAKQRPPRAEPQRPPQRPIRPAPADAVGGVATGLDSRLTGLEPPTVLMTANTFDLAAPKACMKPIQSEGRSLSARARRTAWLPAGSRQPTIDRETGFPCSGISV